MIKLLDKYFTEVIIIISFSMDTLLVWWIFYKYDIVPDWFEVTIKSLFS